MLYSQNIDVFKLSSICERQKITEISCMSCLAASVCPEGVQIDFLHPGRPSPIWTYKFDLKSSLSYGLRKLISNALEDKIPV